MPRTPTITDEQILDAAREVFLSQGVKASTIEIAQRAGISEALLFKRFKTKEQLFSKALSTLDTPWISELEKREGKGDLKQNLVAVGLQALEHLQCVLPRLMMLWSSKRAPLRPPAGIDNPDARALKALTGFLEAERRRGRLSVADPEIMARALLGGVHSYVFMTLTGGDGAMPIPAPTFIRSLVEMLWFGVAPRKL